MSDPGAPPVVPAVPLVPPVVTRRRGRGFGVAALVLGILLVFGELLWVGFGALLFPALVWVFPIVVVLATVVLVIHVLVALIAVALGIVAIVQNRGRIAGLVGIVLTLLSTAVIVVIGVFFGELVSILSYTG